MKTRIIVDSTADLVPEIKARVSTVPLTVHFGQEEYIDGVTIDNKHFMKAHRKRCAAHHQSGNAGRLYKGI